ncbi:hypothetical protein NEAUS06_2513 [Nematocida ausubeli]|nr:hypothetical protein NEAUS06_2513 [Nematocida ausubeli]
MDEQGIPSLVQRTNCEPHEIWCEEDKRPIEEMGSHELILFGILILLLIGFTVTILLLKRFLRRVTAETHHVIYRPRGTNRYRPGLSTIQEESMSDSDIQRLNNPAYTNRQEISPLISSGRPEHFPPTYDEAMRSTASSVGSNTAEQSELPTYIEAVTRST